MLVRLIASFLLLAIANFVVRDALAYEYRLAVAATSPTTTKSAGGQRVDGICIGVHVIGGSENPGRRMYRPGLMTFPLMIVGPMYTLIGPTFGGTNVSSGDGGADVAGAVAATAPATGTARPSTLIDAAATDSVRSRMVPGRIRETR